LTLSPGCKISGGKVLSAHTRKTSSRLTVAIRLATVKRPSGDGMELVAQLAIDLLDFDCASGALDAYDLAVVLEFNPDLIE
jgi:hypothetical protein